MGRPTKIQAVYRTLSKRREQRLLCRYNLSRKRYLEFLVNQNYRCAICKELPSPGRQLVVDHDHKTGIVRGLTCPKCNAGLGMFKDNILVLEEAIRYLERVEMSLLCPKQSEE